MSRVEAVVKDTYTLPEHGTVMTVEFNLGQKVMLGDRFKYAGKEYEILGPVCGGRHPDAEITVAVKEIPY
jgi:hypothetical protein